MFLFTSQRTFQLTFLIPQLNTEHWQQLTIALLRYGRLKFSKWPPDTIFGFDPIGNGVFQFSFSENPTLEPNMKGIG